MQLCFVYLCIFRHTHTCLIHTNVWSVAPYVAKIYDHTKNECCLMNVTCSDMGSGCLGVDTHFSTPATPHGNLIFTREHPLRTIIIRDDTLESTGYYCAM